MNICIVVGFVNCEMGPYLWRNNKKFKINLNMNNIFRVNNIITYEDIADTLKT